MIFNIFHKDDIQYPLLTIPCDPSLLIAYGWWASGKERQQLLVIAAPIVSSPAKQHYQKLLDCLGGGIQKKRVNQKKEIQKNTNQVLVIAAAIVSSPA